MTADKPLSSCAAGPGQGALKASANGIKTLASPLLSARFALCSLLSRGLWRPARPHAHTPARTPADDGLPRLRHRHRQRSHTASVGLRRRLTAVRLARPQADCVAKLKGCKNANYVRCVPHGRPDSRDSA